MLRPAHSGAALNAQIFGGLKPEENSEPLMVNTPDPVRTNSVNITPPRTPLVRSLVKESTLQHSRPRSATKPSSNNTVQPTSVPQSGSESAVSAGGRGVSWNSNRSSSTDALATELQCGITTRRSTARGVAVCANEPGHAVGSVVEERAACGVKEGSVWITGAPKKQDAAQRRQSTPYKWRPKAGGRIDG